jgi:hypothetical protein
MADLLCNRDQEYGFHPNPPEIAKRYDKPSLQIIPYKGGLKATIIGAAQSLVRISIIRADGKIVHQKKMYVSGKVSHTYGTEKMAVAVVFILCEWKPHMALWLKERLYSDLNQATIRN